MTEWIVVVFTIVLASLRSHLLLSSSFCIEFENVNKIICTPFGRKAEMNKNLSM